MYPIEKYRFYTHDRKVIAVSTYAGKTVRGVSECAPSDKFDLETGKKIAAARCAVRIAKKRVARAERKYEEANEMVKKARSHLVRMRGYLYDAKNTLREESNNLYKLLDQ